MQWKNVQDRTSILQSATGKRDQETMALVESLAKHFDDGGDIKDFEPELIYSPDQLANAFLLLVSHFDAGAQFYEELPWFARHLVLFQSALVLEHQRKAAASASHRGEADEGLS